MLKYPVGIVDKFKCNKARENVVRKITFIVVNVLLYYLGNTSQLSPASPCKWIFNGFFMRIALDKQTE